MGSGAKNNQGTEPVLLCMSLGTFDQTDGDNSGECGRVEGGRVSQRVKKRDGRQTEGQTRESGWDGGRGGSCDGVRPR